MYCKNWAIQKIMHGLKGGVWRKQYTNGYFSWLEGQNFPYPVEISQRPDQTICLGERKARSTDSQSRHEAKTWRYFRSIQLNMLEVAGILGSN